MGNEKHKSHRFHVPWFYHGAFIDVLILEHSSSTGGQVLAKGVDRFVTEASEGRARL